MAGHQRISSTRRFVSRFSHLHPDDPAAAAQISPLAPRETDSATAINGTSSNTNAVATMDTPFANDPPTSADMETMRAAYNALVLAARR